MNRKCLSKEVAHCRLLRFHDVDPTVKSWIKVAEEEILDRGGFVEELAEGEASEVEASSLF